MWEEDVRIEELDSDDTDTQGVGLISGEKRFASDPLQFTGIDLTQQPMTRRSYAFDDGGSSSGLSGSEEDRSSPMQIALRDKEEALVQSALARIRRAQEKGKLEVKLNKEELDALERRRKRMQAAATQKKKGSSSGSGSEKKRRSERNLISVPIASLDPGSQPSSRPSSRKTNSKSSKSKRSGSNPPPPSGAPGMVVNGPDGPMYAPIGFYPVVQGGSNHNSPSRARSSSTAQPLAQGPPPLYPSPLTNRQFSDGMRPTSSSSTSSRRPLPDEEGWIPGSSRRSSVSSQNYGIDPFEYQTSSGFPPRIPEQYLQQGRRNISNPSDIAYASIRRSPPAGSGYPAAARGPASDPTLRHRSSYRDELGGTESTEDESDDLGNGVQVYDEEKETERERERERPVSRKPVGSSGRKKGKR